MLLIMQKYDSEVCNSEWVNLKQNQKFINVCSL